MSSNQPVAFDVAMLKFIVRENKNTVRCVLFFFNLDSTANSKSECRSGGKENATVVSLSGSPAPWDLRGR